MKPFLTCRPRPYVIAHRGGALLAPENTLIAFENAARLGCDVVELDVWLSRDGHVVVFHDATVERLTNGQGRVAEMPLAEIEALDAGFRFTSDGGRTFPWRGRGARVPTLARVFDALPGMLMNIEVKAHDDAIEPILTALVRSKGRVATICLGSTDEVQASRLRALLPEVCMFFPESAVRHQVTAAKLGERGIPCPPEYDVMDLPLRAEGIDVVDAATADYFRARGIPVHVWTVNEDEDLRRMLALGVDGIMTDRPDRLRALVSH